MQQKTFTFKSLSSEKVSTMIPKIMLRPMVVMKMKKDTWYTTSGQKLLKELPCGLTLISCDVTKVVTLSTCQ